MFGQSFIQQGVVRRSDFDLARYHQKVHVSISELSEKLVTLIVLHSTTTETIYLLV